MKNKLTAIEIGIFSIISVIFVNSIYSLISNKDVDVQATREIASVLVPQTPSGLSDALIEFECQKFEVQETKSPKIRIAGNICRDTSLKQPAVLEETKIENLSLKSKDKATVYQATVFNDLENDRFTTDFIPLEEGLLNKIHVEFNFKGGSKIESELLIKKKSPN